MPREKVIQLQTIYWDNAASGEYARQELGDGVGTVRLELRTDGQGPMGWYDRIHSFLKDGTHEVYPAHFVSGWTLKEKEPTT